MKNLISKYDIITRLIALLVAIILWIWVMDVKNPIRTVAFSNVEVNFVGENTMTSNNDLILISEESPKIKIEFKGPNDVITRMSFDSINVEVNLGNITKSGEYTLEYAISVPYTDVEVSYIEPSRLAVVVDDIITKEIPIKINTIGSTATSYMFTDLEIDDILTVTGPSNEINNISSAYVEIDVTDTNQNILGIYEIMMIDKSGEVINSPNIIKDQTSITVNKQIKKLKEVPVLVDLIFGELVSEKTIESFKLSKSKIALIGTPNQIDRIEEINIGSIYIDEVTQDNTVFTFEAPENYGVEYLGNPEPTFQVEFTLTDYTYNTFEVKNIQNKGTQNAEFSYQLIKKYQDIANNLEENDLSGDYKTSPSISYETKTLSINIYGKEKELSTILANDIIVEPNYEGIILQEGLNEVPCKITIMSTYDFEILNQYTMIVEVN